MILIIMIIIIIIIIIIKIITIIIIIIIIIYINSNLIIKEIFYAIIKFFRIKYQSFFQRLNFSPNNKARRKIPVFKDVLQKSL